MLKRLLFALLCVMAYSGYAQTTETFESIADNSTSFSSGGVTWDLTGQFHVEETTNYGVGPSNRYIDVSNYCATSSNATGSQGSIKTQAGDLFTLNTIWVYTSFDCLGQQAGDVTLIGKVNGAQVTSQLVSVPTISSGTPPAQGFLEITSPFGSTQIDEVEVVVGTGLAYAAVDNFTYTLAPTCALTASISSQTNVACNGASTGSATAAPANGTAPYTYAWSNGATTATVNNIVAGTYTVTITDDNGCTATTSATITQPAALLADVFVDSNATCNGDMDGGVTASPTGGTSPYTYAWNTGSTTAALGGVFAGTYNVTVTDANGCTVTASNTVTEPASLNAAVLIDNNASCNGSNDGAVSAAVTGGFAPYTYAWNNGATTASLTGLFAGAYSVTVTDANGCTATSAGTVNEPVALGVTITSQTNVACNGASTGSLTAFRVNGAGNYDYAWSIGVTFTSLNGSTQSTISSLAAGSYSVTITDGNGCTATTSATITEPTALIGSVSVDSNATCNGDMDGGVTASTTGGVSPYTYLWNTGSTTAALTDLFAGTYTVTITDANGCTTTASNTVTEPASVNVSVQVDSNATCNGDMDGGVTASVTGGQAPYMYAWNTGGNSASLTGLFAGAYNVTVTDANGCTASAAGTVSEPISLSASVQVDSNATCNGDMDGGVTASVSGGQAPYTYAWNTGGNTASLTGLFAGAYNVTVTDANGCTTSAAGTVSEPIAISAVVQVDSNATCNGDMDGGVTASATGGQTPYTYAWNNGGTTASITGLFAGAYNVTVTDANGCTATAAGTVNEPIAISASVQVDSNATCNGDMDGGVTASVSGGQAPYSYAWNTGGNTASLTGLFAGAYNVTVTDANGCTATAAGTVNEPIALSASVQVDSNATCNGDMNGGVTASVSGGQAPYTYAWNNSATTASLTGLFAGAYNVTVTDANGCTASAAGTVNEPIALSASVQVDSNATCNGDMDGGLTASATGGLSPYTYAWSNSATTASITGVAAGAYTVTVTDVNGCTTSSAGTVSEPTALTLALNVDSNETCPGINDGGLTASAAGGVGPYNYLWSNSATTASITGVAGGTYSVTVTDANGCTASNSETVSSLTPFTITASATMNNACNGDAMGAAMVTVSDTLAYTYSWSNGSDSTSAVNLMAGTYTVTVTNATGCTQTASVTITEPTAISASFTTISAIVCNGGTGIIEAAISGGTAPYTLSWNTGADSTGIENVTAGMYYLTITDANNCVAVDSFNLTEPTALSSMTSVTAQNLCAGDANAEATVSVMGGTMPYTYSWSNTATTAAISGLTAGTYYVTATDANNCTITDSIVVTDPTALSLVIDTTDIICNGQTGTVMATVTGDLSNYTFTWSNGVVESNSTVIAGQGFDSTAADTWMYMINPATYNTEGDLFVDGSDDVWAIITEFTGDITSTNGNFFGAQDLNNPNGGGSFFHTIDFAPMSTAGLAGVTVSFDYNTVGFDSSDSIYYEVAFDNDTVWAPASNLMATTGEAMYLNNNTAAWTTVTVAVPDSANNVRLRIAMKQDGASDYAGIDNVTLSTSSPATTASSTISGLGDGTYSVTVTNSNGCTAAGSAVISEPTLLVINMTEDSASSCGSTLDGGASAAVSGGVMPYTYAWSNGSDSASVAGVAAGTYTLTLTDAKGCSVSSQVVVNSLDVTAPMVALDSITVYLDANGAASIAFSDIDNNSADNCGIASTTLDVSTFSCADLGSNQVIATVTDNSGNATSDTTLVTVLDTLNPMLSVPADFFVCSTLPTGDFVTYAAPTATDNCTIDQIVQIAGFASGDSVAFGIYTNTFVAIDNSGNTDTVSFMVEVGPQPSISFANDTICNLDTLVLDATAGFANYTWNTGASTQVINATTAGTYAVTVTDSIGCTANATMDLVVNALPNINLGNDQIVCSNQSLTLFATPNMSTYVWSDNSTNPTLAVTATGNYSVTITNANGCSNSDNINITVEQVPVLALADTIEICANETATLDAGTGADWAVYSWSNGSFGQTTTTTMAGTYTVTVTDLFVCSSVDTIEVVVNQLPSVNLGADTAFCDGNQLTLTAPAGLAYAWSTGATTASETVTSTGVFGVTVTDANNCSNSDDISVVVNSLPTVSLGADFAICEGSTETLDAGAGFNSYNWSTTATTQTIDVTAAGTYTVSVTDANGCENNDAVEITVNALPNPELVDTAYVCENGVTQLTSAAGFVSYDWSTGNQSQNIFVDINDTGFVTLTVIDANGCSATDTTLLLFGPCVSVSEVQNTVSVSAYPNPTRNNLTIEIDGNTQPATVRFIDLTGRIVLTERTTGVATQMNVGHLAKGTYVMSVTLSDGRVQHSNIIIE